LSTTSGTASRRIFDHDAEAVAVGFIAQRGNALELLVAHQFADAFDQMRLLT